MNSRIRLRVADLCYDRGLVSRTGRSPGKPHVRALVARTGLPTKMVQKIVRRPCELDMLSFRALERLCYALECQPGELFGWDDAQPPRPPTHPSPAHTPPPRDRAQRWQAQRDRDQPSPPRPALPDWDEGEEEDYLLPEHWRQLHPDAPLSPESVWASEQNAEPGRQEWDRQVAAPGSEPGAQPMPPRQVGLYESI